MAEAVSRADAIRKVRGLMALADRDDGPEAQSAGAMATRLRLKYGISDDEIGGNDEETEDFVFFGKLFLYYGKRVTPQVQRIRDLIDAVLAELDTLDPLNRAEMYVRFHKDLKLVVEGDSYRHGLKKRRDKVVKLYYESLAEEQREWDHSRAAERVSERSAEEIKYEASPEHQVYAEKRVHEHARDYTAMRLDLRKDTVERIVGISEKGLWLKMARAVVCTKCGLDGNEKRQTCEYYKDDDEHYAMHPACHDEALVPKTSR